MNGNSHSWDGEEMNLLLLGTASIQMVSFIWPAIKSCSTVGLVHYNRPIVKVLEVVRSIMALSSFIKYEYSLSTKHHWYSVCNDVT